MTSNAATLSWESLASAAKLILTSFLCTIAVMVLMTLAVCIRRRIAPGRFFKAMREGMIIAATSNSELAAMPSLIRGTQQLGVSTENAQLLVPLATSLYKIGNVVFMVVMSLFVVQLYGHELAVSDVVIIFFGCVLASPALDNESFSGPLSLLSGVLNPMGLPAEASMVLIDPIVDPLLSLLGAFGIATAPLFIDQTGQEPMDSYAGALLDPPLIDPPVREVAETP